MSRSLMRLLLPAFLVLPLDSHVGGWAVITVKDLPDNVEAGKPMPLSFIVRQHGQTMLDGLSPRIIARSGSLDARAAARPGGDKGHYVASLTLPRAGDWTITIESGFGNSNITLLPVRALDAGTKPPVIAASDRGRRLFIAKGCVTCHVHKEAPTTLSVAAGPDLTFKRFAPEYLTKYLADPSIGVTERSKFVKMPNLGLAPQEIASLVAFINADRQVSAR